MPKVVLADTLHIAAASNFAEPARKIARLFEQSSNHKVRLSFASSGKLFIQISNGAPYDIFLSADSERPKRLVEKGLALKDSLFTYAIGRLVLYSREPELKNFNSDILSQGARFNKLAIANPLTAPYGQAAMDTLENLGLKEAMADKLVRGDNIAQTYQFVSTRNAQLGFVALSQVTDQDPSAGWIVPSSLHRPILQQGVLLTKASGSGAAHAFLQFLKQPEIRALIKSSGYNLP